MPLQRALFSLFIVSIDMFWQGAIWCHLDPFGHFTTFHRIPSMSRIQRRRWWVLHLTDVSHLISQDWLRSQTHESMNRSTVTSNFSEDVAALAAPGSKEGKTMENMETCWGRCVFFMQMLQTWSNAGHVAGRSQGEERGEGPNRFGKCKCRWVNSDMLWLCYCCDCHSFEANRILSNKTMQILGFRLSAPKNATFCERKARSFPRSIKGLFSERATGTESIESNLLKYIEAQT